MKKQTYNNQTIKDFERLKQENKKIKEEYEKYKEISEDKLKDLEFLSIQYEKTRKENEELKKKLAKASNNTNQSILLKTIDKLKYDMYHKDSSIKILTKHRDLLISILTKLGCKKNNISSEMLLSYLEEDNEKEKEYLINKIHNEIINIIKENNKKLNLKNMSITNYSFDIIYQNKNKIISTTIKKNIITNKNCCNSQNNNSEENKLSNNNNEKELELIKKINEMLFKIQRRKELLKAQKNTISLRLGAAGIEGK